MHAFASDCHWFEGLFAVVVIDQSKNVLRSILRFSIKRGLVIEVTSSSASQSNFISFVALIIVPAFLHFSSHVHLLLIISIHSPAER